MNKSKILKLITATLLVAAMGLSVSGCGDDTTDASNLFGDLSSQQSTTADDSDSSKDDSADNQDDSSATVSNSFPTEITSELVGTLKGEEIKHQNQYGFIFTSGDKYGAAAVDGSNDTGAVFDYLTKLENEESYTDSPYCQGVKTYNSKLKGLDAVNIWGLYDYSGNQILPEKYAIINPLNDRYIQVITATGTTKHKDEALFFQDNSSSLICKFSPDKGDTLYKGKWEIYDVTTGKKLKKASGTQNTRISACANLIKYIDDDNNEFILNEKEEEITPDYQFLSHGYYQIEGVSETQVFDEGGNHLFTYSKDDYDSLSYKSNGYEDYFVASKYDSDSSNFTYCVLDTSGTKISTDFNENLDLYGDFLVSDEKIMDYQGKIISKEKVESCYFDTFTKNCWIISNDDKYIFLDREGNVLVSVNKSDSDYSVSTGDFSASKKQDSGYKNYCFGDKDYTLGGYDLANFLVKESTPKGTYDLRETLTGYLLTNADKDYTRGAITSDGMYIYGTTDDTIHVYFMKAK